MPIRIPTSRQTLANAYGGLGVYVAAATGDPGATSTVTNEVTGGSYARVATTWSSGTGGILNGTQVTLAIPGGVTVTYGAICSAATGATMTDNAAITNTTFSVAGNLIATPGYTQT